MSTSPLSIDVYVAPMRPYTCPDQLGEGEVATWAPSSSTLIAGPTDGILIDALLTFENADQIAAWAKSFGKKITGVYITMATRTAGSTSRAFSCTSPRLVGTRLRRLQRALLGRWSSTRKASDLRRRPCPVQSANTQ